MQYGPSFPTSEVSFDRKSGQYKARSQVEKDDKQKVAGGKFEMPDDLYNGMALILLKNLPGEAGATVHMDRHRYENKEVGGRHQSYGGHDQVFGSE